MMIGEESFWRFVQLRQMAWFNKEVERTPPPYSDDPLIARYHFTNVFRELDKGTIYFHRRLGERYGGRLGSASMIQVVRASIVYRLANRIETFEAYGGIPELPRDIKQFVKFATERMDDPSVRLFTGRHYNRGFNDYVRTISDDAAHCRTADLIECSTSMLQVVDSLKEIHAIGDFFAWQIACDLNEAGMLWRVVDRDRWAHLGSGALIGLGLVVGETLRQRDAMPHVLALVDSPRNQFDLGIVPVYLPNHLTAKNVEHALCEYGRWARANSRPSNNFGLEVKPWAKS